MDSPVELRHIGDVALVRVLCESAPSDEILSRIAETIESMDSQKMVMVLENLGKVDSTLADFLCRVDDMLADIPLPLVVFEASGFFESLAGSHRPYLFSRSESDALDHVASEFWAKRPREEGEKTRILIIEDDVEVMEFLTDLLATEDRFEVHTATSGFEGGLATACFRPHLILLDIMLPDIDGRDICRILRNNKNVGNPMIIAITALSREKDVSEIISAGVDDYLGKPFRINVLMKKIAHLLSKDGGGTE
jgi:CheY-like chemotaxis protein